MSWSTHEDGREPARSVHDELRSALGQEPDFDHAALVAGVHARAGRIRRRRALTQTLAAAVLVPTLVGTGFVINQRLSVEEPAGGIAVASQAPTVAPAEDGIAPSTASASSDTAMTTAPETMRADEPLAAATTPGPTTPPLTDDQAPAEEGPAEQAAPAPEQPTGTGLAVEDPGGEGPDPATDPGADPTDEAQAPTDPPAGLPPYQDPSVPLPDVPGGPSTDGLPNRIDVPDPRPTGVALLDGSGAPYLSERYQNITPLMGITSTQELSGTEHHSARSWQYSTAGGWDGVVITLTAWDDSRQALAGLTSGDLTMRSRWLGPLPTRQPWPGHEGDPDFFLTSVPTLFSDAPQGTVVGVAMVRQGDYLVAVAVDGADDATITAQAAEIAEKTAANLAVLDPAHGVDPAG